MRCVALTEASTMLPELHESAVCDHEEIVVTHENGNVVLIAQDDWEMTQETLRLLRDRTALGSLLEGHRVRDEGGTPTGKTPEAVFHDLVDQHSAAG